MNRIAELIDGYTEPGSCRECHNPEMLCTCPGGPEGNITPEKSSDFWLGIKSDSTE